MLLSRGVYVAFTIASSCIACGDCWNACPQDSAIIPGDLYRIDEDACLACGVCADICPTSSIFEPRPVTAGGGCGAVNHLVDLRNE
ncbi:4Fe-4S binding protein [uncultured Thiodictyon sp.]|uniref:4Fe-4S binding protein n=1 Tax=uncultured Thiodictyon sp. TaxID=1846217 RepID=UPI0025EC1D96|nr:4Fe-4S binding protein [uncultured Thiodictyon sp.]